MKEILPIIMNTAFERLAVIDDYISLIWTSRYYEVGDFELVVADRPDYMQLFKQDYYILRDDDENVGVIEDIVIQHSEDGGDIMIITGRFLASILGRRIIAAQTTVANDVVSNIYELVNKNAISPSVSARKISRLLLDTDQPQLGVTFKAQYTGTNLLEAVSEICKTYGVGFKCVFYQSNILGIKFSVYQGKDRTYNQSVNPWVVFSDEYDNLLSSEYEENYTSMANAVLVAGEGEGLDRTTAWVTDGSTDLNRREIYKDQRQIRSNDGEISDAEYQQLLESAGKEAMTKYTTAFTGTVYFGNIKYKQDVDLGDLCVIENSRWGISMNARLVEVIESVAETGEYSIVPTFGV